MSPAGPPLRQAEPVQLQDLVHAAESRGFSKAARITGDPTVEVRTSTHDSRKVGPATLYFCVSGASFDGHDFASGAVAAGATALVCERPLDVDVPQVLVDGVRSAMGPLAALLADMPTDVLDVVGITGTNGKTTTAHLLDAIAAHAGRSSRITQMRTITDNLRGEVELTQTEELGRLLFFSQQFTNCNQCHQLRRSAIDPAEPLSQ